MDRAELALLRARGDVRRRGLQLLRPRRAGKARLLPRAARQRVSTQARIQQKRRQFYLPPFSLRRTPRYTDVITLSSAWRPLRTSFTARSNAPGRSAGFSTFSP